MIHLLYQLIPGFHDQDALGIVFVWNAVLTVVAITAYLRNR